MNIFFSLFILTAALVSCKIVIRRSNGDVFEIQNGFTCENAGAMKVNSNLVPGTTNTCQCYRWRKTLFFRGVEGDRCLEVDESVLSELFLLKDDRNVYKVPYDKSKGWMIGDTHYLVDHKNKVFDIKSCSNRKLNLKYWDNTDYGFWTNLRNANFLQIKQTSPGLNFNELDKNNTMLTGKLIKVNFTCENQNNLAHTFKLKFSGLKNYPKLISKEYTIRASEVTRNVSGDTYSYSGGKNASCRWGSTYMEMVNESPTQCKDIDDLYREEGAKLLQIGRGLKVYTVKYLNNLWSLPETDFLRRVYTNTSRETSFCELIAVTSIERYDYDVWTKVYDLYLFKILHYVEYDANAIQFTGVGVKDFEGQLYRIHFSCAGEILYIKFEGFRQYYYDTTTSLPQTTDDYYHEMTSEILPTTMRPATSRYPFTTRHPVTKPTPTLPPRSVPNEGDDEGVSTTLIIGAVVGAVVGFIILVALIYFCCYKPKRRHHKSSQNSHKASPNPYVTNDVPWKNSASDSLQVPKDPKEQEAEEVLQLAMEILKERKSVKSDQPDVVPCYIKNRPLPQQMADPRPKIGPLAVEDNYIDPKYMNNNSGQGGDYAMLDLNGQLQEEAYLDLETIRRPEEETYLDLEQTQEEYYKELDIIQPDMYA